MVIWSLDDPRECYDCLFKDIVRQQEAKICVFFVNALWALQLRVCFAGEIRRDPPSAAHLNPESQT